MKIMKFVAALCFSMVCLGSVTAQETPRKVENATILSLDGKSTQIPHWGKKNLLIFYVDPDRAGQNQKFTEDLEASGRAKGENLVGMGIINLKDAPFIPNKLARSMAEKRTEKNHATVLADQERTISKEWGLGDCNNTFVTILINRDGEIVYVHKGEFSSEEEAKFLQHIDILK